MDKVFGTLQVLLVAALIGRSSSQDLPGPGFHPEESAGSNNGFVPSANPFIGSSAQAAAAAQAPLQSILVRQPEVVSVDTQFSSPFAFQANGDFPDPVPFSTNFASSVGNSLNLPLDFAADDDLSSPTSGFGDVTGNSFGAAVETESFRSNGGSNFVSSASGLPAAGPPGNIDFSKAQRTPDGRLCVVKEVSVQSLSKEPVLECTHQNVEKCHYTYVTYFRPSQEEVCEENFEKNCQITFKKQAATETVKKCYRPQVKVCNGQGPQVCRTVFESSCTTRYVEKNQGKFVGDTKCEKLPVEICGAGCVTEEGPEECHDKQVTSQIDVPEETCDLNPQKACRLGTKLLPNLKPEHECTIIPKEICHLKFSTPKIEQKPLRTEWCLDESPQERDESGYDESSALGPPLSP